MHGEPSTRQLSRNKTVKVETHKTNQAENFAGCWQAGVAPCNLVSTLSASGILKVETQMKNQIVDIKINFGGISIIEPLTQAGWAWIKRNVQFESWQETAGGIAFEPNMAAAIADGATESGLCVA